jgi:hypothetical protein
VDKGIKGANIMSKFERINGNIVCGREIAEMMTRKKFIRDDFELTPKETQALDSRIYEENYRNKDEKIEVVDGVITINRDLEARIQALREKRSEIWIEQQR